MLGSAFLSRLALNQCGNQSRIVKTLTQACEGPRAHFSATPSSGSPIFSTYIDTIVKVPASTT
jgi:hypothetical protein